MLVAQITDLHVAPDGSFMREFVDSNVLLARAVEYLNSMTPRPDVVLATGDLTDHGTSEEYALLREILGALEIPLYLIPGNHDEIEKLLAPLDERERQILALRFGLDRGEPRTLEEVGEFFNLTRERIRQIEARAMSKLRHPSADTGARDLLAV